MRYGVSHARAEGGRHMLTPLGNHLTVYHDKGVLQIGFLSVTGTITHHYGYLLPKDESGGHDNHTRAERSNTYFYLLVTAVYD